MAKIAIGRRHMVQRAKVKSQYYRNVTTGGQIKGYQSYQGERIWMIFKVDSIKE